MNSFANFHHSKPYQVHMALKQTLRRLAQMPLFTGVAVLTLAIGIGANTAIFSVIQGVLLKPLPYPQSDELVKIDHRTTYGIVSLTLSNRPAGSAQGGLEHPEIWN